jgi:hypothetical protein
MHSKVALFFAVAAICQASESLAARWEGAVEIPGRELRVVIDLAQDGRGQWVGSAIVPGFGVKGAPLTDITVEGADVSFTMKGALGGPKFKGRLTAAGALAGDYQQAGNTAPFQLQKAGPAQVEPPRGSTSVAREFEGEWQGEMYFIDHPVRVRLKMTNQADGKAKAEFFLVGRREVTVPLDLVIQESDNLTVESPETGMSYEGRFRKDGNEFTGTFSQGPFEVPLVLRPVGKS